MKQYEVCLKNPVKLIIEKDDILPLPKQNSSLLPLERYVVVLLSSKSFISGPYLVHLSLFSYDVKSAFHAIIKRFMILLTTYIMLCMS